MERTLTIILVVSTALVDLHSVCIPEHEYKEVLRTVNT